MSSAAIFIHRSNRAETLAQRFAETCLGPVSNPFEPETVVVQGRGMSIWLSQQVSKAHGVAANLQFVYPKHFFQQTLKAVLDDEGTLAENYTRDRLFWGVFESLPRHLDHSAFSQLASYLSKDENGTRRFQLCELIAHTFDQYLTYRPELLLSWERKARPAGKAAQLGLFEGIGEGASQEEWQARLWRGLIERLGPNHAARLERRLLNALHKKAARFSELPTRISVFGISSLPPLYARVIAALAHKSEVHLYLLSPTSAFWADLPGVHAEQAQLITQVEQDSVFDESANALVSSLGLLGAEFLRVLDSTFEAQGVSERSASAGPGTELYEDPGRSTLLCAIQNDILAFKNNESLPKLAADDGSLSVHSCHSAMREVEVLHDQLLELFATDPSLEPHDVVVMMPDVDRYAPLIEAVFERTADDVGFIPYRIADRSLRREAPAIDGFRRILDLVDTRAKASEILDLLTIEAIRRRFGILPEDLEDITQWVIDSNIRWGIDGAHRSLHGQPEWRENTWEFGLRRLLLGYALPPQGQQLFCGELPLDEVEGVRAQLLGRFAQFASVLFRTFTTLRQPRLVGEWQQVLGDVLDRLLINTAETAWQHHRLRGVLDEIVADAAAVGFNEPVHLDVMRQLIDRRLDDSHALGFLSGGVSFCAMVPMRSIPFRVVCMIGMEHRAFPRHSSAPNFDLIVHGAEGHRAGDRSRRNDDRYLFLEALLSARQRLLITFTGQSVKDNTAVPPSVVVSELLDYVREHYASKMSESDRARLEARLFVEHPLQPFSPRYFNRTHPALFSYESSYVAAAASLTPVRKFPKPLLEGSLEPQNQRERSIGIIDLVRFFQGPLRYLLNQRLGLFLRDTELDVPDREPQELSPLDGYALGNDLLQSLKDGASREQIEALARASGALPHGNVGRMEFDDAMQSATPIAENIADWTEPGALPAISVSRHIASWHLSGELADRYGRGIVHSQFARVQWKHALRTWIHHLLLCWLAPAPEHEHSVLVGRPDTGQGVRVVQFQSVATPERYLEEFLECFELGENQPLHFFPNASLAFARSLAAGHTKDQALYSAQGAFQKDLKGDPYLLRVYGANARLSELPDPAIAGASFSDLAIRIAAPLLQHLEDA